MGSVLLVLALVLWEFRSRTSALDHYKAQLLAQGEVLDIDSLAPKRTGKEPNGNDYSLSITNNLTPWAITNTFSGQYDWILSGTNQWQMAFPSTFSLTNRTLLWSALEKLIESNRVDIAIIRYPFTVASPPKDLGLDYRLGIKYPLPHYWRHIHQFAPLLRLTVIADVHGPAHPDEAFSSMLGLMGLADYLSDEWTVYNQLSRTRILNEAHKATWYAVESHAWDEAKLKQLQNRWESISVMTNFHQSLLYDRALRQAAFTAARADAQEIRDMFSSINTGFHATHPDHPLWEWWWYRFGIDADELLSLKLDQSALELWRQMLAHPRWAEGLAQIETDFNKWTGNRDPDDYKAKRYRMTYWWGTPIKLTSKIVHTEILRLQTITALALERHRLKHGHYSDALTKLIPDYLRQIPLDPMDGRPLRYRLNPDGTFTLWSVGFDGQDNGGDSTMPNPKKQNYPQDAKDLVWPRIDPIDLPPKR